MNVVFAAVPGAGKTHLLLECARGRRALFLAYNKEIARRVRARVDVDVCTFHALCGRHLAPAQDDVQLEAAVVAAEDGSAPPTSYPEAEVVLVDECQDVRELYVRLLRVLRLLEGPRLCLAGETRQLIYDFDPDFAPYPEALEAPERVFGGAWERRSIEVSRRLTTPMVAVLNRVFGTSVRSDRPGPPVEVRAPASAFALVDCLEDLLFEEQDVMLLVDRKRNNRPLRAVLNTLSQRGRAVHVHGYEGESGLQVGTYWSAKGLECDTAVVLLPRACAPNPLYVALTRARRRLVLVLDPRAPHAAVCAAARELVADGTVLLGQRAPTVVLVQGDEPASLRAPVWGSPEAPAEDAGTDLDRRSLGARALHALPLETTLVRTPTSAPVDGVGWALVRTARVLAEVRCTGVVRAMEHALRPTLLSPRKRNAASALGFVGRSVAHTAPTGDALAADLLARATAAYDALRTDREDVVAAATVALAVEVWDEFDFRMRRLLPVETWACTPAASEALAFARDAWPPDATEFDTRLRGPEGHVGAHATGPTTACLVTWVLSSADANAAALVASVHEARACTLVCLGEGRVRRLRLWGCELHYL